MTEPNKNETENNENSKKTRAEVINKQSMKFTRNLSLIAMPDCLIN